MYIFLFRDGMSPMVLPYGTITYRKLDDTGTVISIHSNRNLDFTAPITHRLRQTDTVLRKSPDPSILVHALLDLSASLCYLLFENHADLASVVDRALQVTDAYHDKINKFERDILIQPKVETIRHCMSSLITRLITSQPACSAYSLWGPYPAQTHSRTYQSSCIRAEAL